MKDYELDEHKKANAAHARKKKSLEHLFVHSTTIDLI